QLLTGQLPIVAPAQATESPRRRMARYGFLTSISGILLAALFGVLGGAFSNLDGDLGAFVASLAGIGGLAFMAGLFMMLYSLFLPKAATSYQPPQQLPQAQPFMQMPPRTVPRPRVERDREHDRVTGHPGSRTQPAQCQASERVKPGGAQFHPGIAAHFSASKRRQGVATSVRAWFSSPSLLGERRRRGTPVCKCRPCGPQSALSLHALTDVATS
ncbi:MAG TPA: hypothetical protein VNO70_01530, partial [Blastocatellia bacterium]|nr:hypothetical protein [Blastocatellia bacterium]